MDTNKIESLLSQILETQKTMLETQNSMQLDITEIKDKVNSVYDQTAELTEFRTETKDQLNTINDDIKFIKHKLHENEEEVFRIKNHLKIIK
ncbi:hypothetical protein PMY38_10025 [Clostridium tertium]|uniref:hypothetical protein n=1 Tax=Clostridium tertium TaxID=1559 RepID=UPI000C0871D9|nr:hypothetical protein [Clostridium tertium]MBS6501615.1 hypothetical protein [Clostridium sp.]DAO81064.1 MAG TPA: hypothetical protein [Caudoviricetes sp.]MDB1955379.1 hypothetical protein [Clostridium tertium]MDB1958935.1 hypothetical protein [Clostridium tertium]MDB1963811.1 hypothetical protein [Clostridium tertium]